MKKKWRVLVLAEDCNPEWPSLPIVGYKAAKALADVAEVTVVTQIRNKPNIDASGFGNANVDYIDTEYIARPIHRLLSFLRGNEGSWTTVIALNYPSYLAFEWEVWKKYKRALESGEFDYVHRITPMSPTLPSFIASRSPVPFIIGPLNGGLKWPKEFTAQRNQEKEWMTLVRNAYKYLPYSRSTYKKAACILASFKHTISEIPESEREKIIDFPEVGIDPELFNSKAKNNDSATKKILFAGRLVPYKMPELVVKAFAESTTLKQRHELIIVGDGPLLPTLECLIKENNLEHCVKLVGWKTQKEVGEYMRDCHIFAFPSVRELGAGVIVEAMACGMPCAVLNYGAPGTLISDECGIRIDIDEIPILQKNYTSALEKLVDHPELTALGTNASNRAKKLLSWKSKAEKTTEIYAWLAGDLKGKPEFW